MAIDIGTSGIKAGVFDTEGKLVCFSRSRHTAASPQPGWSEQSPDAWWTACADCVKEVARSVDTSRLLGICVTGLAPAMVYLNEQGEPVRAAPIWSDSRALAERRELAERMRGGTPLHLLSQVLWLKRNEAEVFERVRWVLESFEFINFKLTGRVAGIAHRPDRPYLAMADVEDCGLNFHIFPARTCMPGTSIGLLLPGIASRLGIACRPPVFAGTVDTFSAWLGTATVARGTLCSLVGTSSSITLVWDRPLDDKLGRVSCMPHITGSDWAVTGAMSNGGLVVDWFARQFYQGSARPLQELTEEAASVAAGADGLIGLPYLQGERSPIFDPLARGVFFGIGHTHTRAHFARAILESIAFAARHVCDTIKESGGEVGEIRVGGAIARNDVWAQIMSDMLGQPLLIPETANSSLLGAAAIAAFGAGRFESLKQAAQMMVKTRSRLEPAFENHHRYSQMFESYTAIYSRLKEVFVANASPRAHSLDS